MKNRVCLLIWAISSLFCGCAMAKHNAASHLTPAATQAANADDAVTQAINRYIRRDHVPGVAVALYYKGKPYFYNFGVANKTTRMPVTEKTLFELGSVTKVFTGILLADQVQKGHMRLNDSVMYHLAPVIPKKDTPLTRVSLQNLATHTSGMPSLPPGLNYLSSQFWRYDSNQLFAYLSHWRPYARVGKQYLYSNLGFSVLGYAEAKAANMPYDQLLHQTILQPLSMTDTVLTIPPQKMMLKAQGYYLSDRAGRAPDWPTNAFAPASVLHSNARDMMRFLEACVCAESVPFSLRNAMLLSQKPYYPFPRTHGGYQAYMGLGWQLSRFDNKTLLDKTGDTFGFGSYIAVIPEQKIGIVILANKPTRMGFMRSRPTIDAAKAIFRQLA